MRIQTEDHRPLPAAVVACAAKTVPHDDQTIRVSGARRAAPVFDVVVEPRAGRIELVGEFDIAGGQRFRDTSGAITRSGAAEVVIDVTRLRFIDASALGLLVELRNELDEKGATLRIVNADARIGRVFSVCGLNAMLTVPVAS